MAAGVAAAEVAADMDQLPRVAEYDEGEPSNGLMIDAGRPVTRIAAAVREPRPRARNEARAAVGEPAE